MKKTAETLKKIRADLFGMADPAYRDFHAALIPMVDKARVIGVRTPALRRYARALPKEESAVFLASLPHEYYEEKNLHAFLLESIREPALLVPALEDFFPCIDNWATCDMMNPRALAGIEPPALFQLAAGWISSPPVYAVRFGILTLQRYFLSEQGADPQALSLVAGIRREEYYIRMMAAWFFATALTLQYDATLPYFTSGELPLFIHNKAISKARDSHRIPKERKAALAALRRPAPTEGVR